MVPRIKCKDNNHLSQLVQGVIEEGGEGVILRKANSLYTPGRSRSLVKLKVGKGGEGNNHKIIRLFIDTYI